MKSYSPKPDSREIARRAGVSQATVSRVLSGGARVSEEMRDKVLRVARELNYQPNVFARAMKTNRSDCVGVVVSRITNPIVPEILLRLGENVTSHGRRMVVWNADTEGQDRVITAIRQQSVDGLVFTAASQKLAAMDAALDVGVPFISINRRVVDARCDEVICRNREGGRAIVDYLVANGRARIGMINGPSDRSTLADRETGVRDGLAEHDLEFADGHYARADFQHEAFRDCALHIMRSSQPPEAIICGNDVIALAVLCGLRAGGFSAPEDVWVVGFDGIEMAGWDVFDLTTMAQPLDAMAVATVDQLVARIEGSAEPPRSVSFPTKLVIRGTTAHAPQKTSINET